jgi:hypothetical protein
MNRVNFKYSLIKNFKKINYKFNIWLKKILELTTFFHSLFYKDTRLWSIMNYNLFF